MAVQIKSTEGKLRIGNAENWANIFSNKKVDLNLHVRLVKCLFDHFIMQYRIMISNVGMVNKLKHFSVTRKY